MYTRYVKMGFTHEISILNYGVHESSMGYVTWLASSNLILRFELKAGQSVKKRSLRPF